MGVALAPANGKGAGTRLLQAGAREVYWGFYDEAWTRRFGPWAFLNRMSSFGVEANSLTFDELLGEVAQCRALDEEGQPPFGLFCTFNSPHYTSEQRRFIEQRYLPRLAEAGLSGIIVSEPALIRPARALGMAAVASTMCAVYNEDLARFYRDAGASRIILPRDLGLDEIEEIVASVPGPSYEAFLMRNGCVFADSHCLGLHRSGCPSLCRSLRTADWWEVSTGGDDAFIQDRLASGEEYRRTFHQSACGQCALWRLEQAGIGAYKVVGRGDRIEDLCTDVALTVENIAIADQCANHEEYLERMERPEWLHTLCAQQGLSCYYPEVCAGA